MPSTSSAPSPVKASSDRISNEHGSTVAGPSTCSSLAAATVRAIAGCRSGPETMSLANSESKAAGTRSPPRRPDPRRTQGPPDAVVPAASGAAGDVEAIEALRGGQEAASGTLGVDPQLDRMPGRLRGRVEGQPLAEGDGQLLGDEIDSGGRLGAGVFDLESGVDLEEGHGPVGGQQEFDGAGAPVVHLGADGFGRTVETLPLLGRQPRGGGLFDELLVAALGRAVAIADGHDAPLPVADDLDLDVARPLQVLLDEAFGPAEGLGRLTGGRIEGGGDLGQLVDDPHPAPATAVGGLDDDRQPRLGGEGLGLAGIGQRTVD